MVEIKLQKIDNGYLVRVEYGYEIQSASGDFLDDTCHYAGNMDAVRDLFALVGIKLQTAQFRPEDAE
jgi:hypothetical protein